MPILGGEGSAPWVGLVEFGLKPRAAQAIVDHAKKVAKTQLAAAAAVTTT